MLWQFLQVTQYMISIADLYYLPLVQLQYAQCKSVQYFSTFIQKAVPYSQHCLEDKRLHTYKIKGKTLQKATFLTSKHNRSTIQSLYKVYIIY